MIQCPSQNRRYEPVRHDLRTSLAFLALTTTFVLYPSYVQGEDDDGQAAVAKAAERLKPETEKGDNEPEETPLQTRILFGELDAVKQDMRVRRWRTQDGLLAVLGVVLVAAVICLFWCRRGGQKLIPGHFRIASAAWHQFDTLAVLESRERSKTTRPVDAQASETSSVPDGKV